MFYVPKKINLDNMADARNCETVVTLMSLLRGHEMKRSVLMYLEKMCSSLRMYFWEEVK
jgi:hypothetical protein